MTITNHPCPACAGGQGIDLLSTTNEWKYYCPTCDVRFNDQGVLMPPADLPSPEAVAVSGSTPAAVTDHSSYELGIICGMEQAAQIADRIAKEYDAAVQWPEDHNLTIGAESVADAIRSGK